MNDKQFETFLEDLNSLFENKRFTKKQKEEIDEHIILWLNYKWLLEK